MSGNAEDFIRRLILAVPELNDVYRQHLSEQDELLPHVLLGDVTRFVVLNATRGEAADWLARFLSQMDAELLSGNDEVAELIGVSFVENLCGENAAIQALLPRLSKALRTEVKSICGVNVEGTIAIRGQAVTNGIHFDIYA